MPLITGQGYQLTPNLVPIADRIGQALNLKRQQARLDEEKAKKEQALQLKQAAQTAGAQALRIRDIKDPTAKRKEIAVMARETLEAGGDPTPFAELLNIQNTDELNMNLTRIAVDASDAGKYIDERLNQQTQQKIGTYNPRDYTVESFAEFRKTGNPASLVRHTEKTVDIGGVPHRLVPGTTNQYEPIKTTKEVAKTEEEISGAKERGKLGAQLKLKPQIESAVVTVRKAAEERGEAFTDLSRMNAALPGLRDTVSQLKELSSIATSTLGGKIFDAAVKESGFGSTKGATAKAKFIAIVNNQVLPLLKPTFGAAFTVQEGESLKATMGDPDASPEQKIAQLDAFIAQKVRDIETKEAQLAPQGAQTIVNENEQALEWAKNNPNDPRSAQILQKLGEQ